MHNRIESPSVSNLNISNATPGSMNAADLLRIKALQRVWWILRHKKTVSIGDSRTNYFDVTTPNASDGNVLRANSLPSPMLFQGVGISVRIPCDQPIADFRDLLPKGFLTLEINQRIDFTA